MLLEAGFDSVDLVLKEESREAIKGWVPGSGAEDYIVSANITAWKAGGAAQTFDHDHGHDHGHGHSHSHTASKAAPPPAAPAAATTGGC